MYLLGILIYLAGFVFTLYVKHIPLSMMVNPAAIFMSITAILAILTATRGFKTFGYGLKAAVFPKAIVPEEEMGRAASLFRMLSKTSAITMLLLVLLNVIHALSFIDDVDALGVGLASTLVAPLWMLTLIVVVFEPVVFIMKKRQLMERTGKSNKKVG